MSRRILYLALFIFGGLLYSSPALAMSNTVGVTATVAEARVIYLDSSGDIQSVLGNTSNNIEPTVNQNGQNIPISSEVYRQYNRLLSEYGGRLQAGRTYFADSYAPYKQLAAWLLNSPILNSKLY